MDLHVK